ncbi:hypothetical protein PRIPAC_76935 [Pristionchus pacificus]|uniref:Uncharacterized protein n=1 Tax=Pristionchus pacificus TaxID=54126 RepID=A0A2A6C2H2_PRIPA|nr:hypothetical protein PRIPAC_76935 [Pristionchus pacificus]|eukprot:PDM72432.1 hypothetical protein PRIPAC_38866 [Pristionchus pacificus]
MDRGVVVGWKGGEQTYLLLECPLDESRNWSGRERDTDGHTDLGTQFSILALATGGLLSLPLSSIPSLENPRPSAWATRRVSPTWIIKRRTQDGF